MIDKAVAEFGKLDVLVNNVGVMDNMATVANFSDEKYEQLSIWQAMIPHSSADRLLP